MAFESSPIMAPFKGVVSNLPPHLTPKNSFDKLANMLVYRGRLITRPRLNSFSSSPDGKTIWDMIPFTDILGYRHNLILTALDAYMLTNNPLTWNELTAQAWSSSPTYQANDIVLYNGTTYFAVASSTNEVPPNTTYWAPLNGNIIAAAVPYGYDIAQGRVYFSNGSFVGLYSDGEATIKSSLCPGAWQFCGMLANHLVACNMTEPPPQVPNSQALPFRVRWSSSGNATLWTISTATSAGFVDLLDVSDVISGFSVNGWIGVVYHPKGLEMMTPTGNGTAPFSFTQITHSPKGVGNFYPYSLDTYGAVSTFVSEEDVYTFDGSSLNPIGGEAKDKIFADLQTAPTSSIVGSIIGRFNAGFLYWSYWLSSPSSVSGYVAGQPVTWVYSFTAKSWHPVYASTALPQLSALANFAI
jgi:hypothetical protein